MMKRITNIVILLMLSACSQSPMFPPLVMKDVKTGSIEVANWKEHPSDVVFQKVELGGQILKAEQQRDMIVILSEELPIVQHPSYPSLGAKTEPPFTFTVSFNQFLDIRWLQPGNRFIVIGQTQGIQPMMIEGSSTSKPYVVAQCLHIWNTEGREISIFRFGGGAYHPTEERTFCMDNTN